MRRKYITMLLATIFIFIIAIYYYVIAIEWTIIPFAKELKLYGVTNFITFTSEITFYTYVWLLSPLMAGILATTLGLIGIRELKIIKEKSNEQE